MTANKKKIYIGIIIVCFGLSGFLLYSTFHSSSAPATVPIVSDTVPTATNPSATNNAIVGQGGTITYHAPAVFPADSKFDWSVVSSTQFQSLTATPSLTLDPSQIGRDDPLKPY